MRRGCVPIAVLMMWRAEQDDCRCVVEIHGFSWEERGVVLRRLHVVFAASGCWVVEYRRRGRRVVEYGFEVALGSVVEMYCGLLHAGVEMTELSHRAMTQLCVLRGHEHALRGRPGVVKLRLVMSFFDAMEEMEVRPLVTASA